MMSLLSRLACVRIVLATEAIWGPNRKQVVSESRRVTWRRPELELELE